ncbi:MAG: hypothetical protein GY909_15850 [Oligoflexia bacterium]|nr:hypothetical protein [Oligoflexia bacterium]
MKHNRDDFCTCSENFSPCEFCFYGACVKCIHKDELNPYCECENRDSDEV